MIYEIGTGLVATEIGSLFDVATFSFSPNGKFFVVGSTGGAVSIWSLPDDVIENIQRVLSQLQVNSEFWSAYPIFIKNSYIDETKREVGMKEDDYLSQ